MSYDDNNYNHDYDENNEDEPFEEDLLTGTGDDAGFDLQQPAASNVQTTPILLTTGSSSSSAPLAPPSNNINGASNYISAVPSIPVVDDTAEQDAGIVAYRRNAENSPEVLLLAASGSKSAAKKKVYI